MLKIRWKSLQLCPAIWGATLLVANGTLAASAPASGIGNIDEPARAAEPIGLGTQAPDTMPEVRQVPGAADSTLMTQTPTPALEQINQYNQEASSMSQVNSVSQLSSGQQPDPMEQITNVTQLRDVSPGDWAFEALRSLVERYGCIAGYPDGTFRGNRATSRFEFAAGLNACLNQIERLIRESGEGFVTREDLEKLQRLVQEFQAELTTLGTRVDTLEGRVAFLEDHQFSTTTKLAGEVVFTVADTFGDTIGQNDDKTKTIFAERVRLNLYTSFTGKDRLQTRLQARNITSFNTSVTGTNMTRLGYDGNESNDVFLQKLEYRFPLGKQGVVYVAATGGEFNDQMFNFNPGFDASGSGALSRFGRFNPIYRESAEGTGATVTYNFSKAIALSAGYMARPGVANNPAEKFGLYDGSYAALAQLAFRSDAFNVGVTYAHAYNTPINSGGINVSESTGSAFASRPFGNVATSADHFGVEANFRPVSSLSLSGWVGYTQANPKVGVDNDAEIWNWAVTLGLSDLGSKGSLLGFVFGMPPKVTDNDISANEDPDTSYHLEGFYRFKVSDNLAITPGVIVIFNPEHNDNNDDIYIGAIRATFTF